MRMTSMPNDTARSTTGIDTAFSGTSTRGKYTFAMRCWLPTSDDDPFDTAVEKYVHGTSAASENNGYGTPSEGTRAKRPKKIVKTTIVRNGCSTLHATPRAVCL